VPSVPPVSAAVQAWHVPVHAALQQTPVVLVGFAQKVLLHWFPPVHFVPLGAGGMQVPDAPGFEQ
jgi:hypothetical protein